MAVGAPCVAEKDLLDAVRRVGPLPGRGEVDDRRVALLAHALPQALFVDLGKRVARIGHDP